MVIDMRNDLLLLKGFDKTSQVEAIQEDNGKFRVRFNNSKVYTYSSANVVWKQSPTSIDPEQYIIYEDEVPLNGLSEILDFGSHVKVIYNGGYEKCFERAAVRLEESITTEPDAHTTFEYLKDLSQYINDSEDGQEGFLTKQFSRLSRVSPRSVLAKYLNGSPLDESEPSTPVFFPFGFNQTQKEATEKAMMNQISAIEGPPGTGKTQTILNIIANAVMKNETVAIVSNNNSATANVLEKLEKYGLDFIAAFLGNSDNREVFFKEQANTYPTEMQAWRLGKEESDKLEQRLMEDQKRLNKMLQVKNEQALLKQKLSAVQLEYKYFVIYYVRSEFALVELDVLKKWSSERLLDLLVDYETKMMRRDGKLNFVDKLSLFLKYRTYRFSKESPDVLTSYLQKLYYERKIEELSQQVEDMSQQLENYHFDEEMDEYRERSMALFKSKLAERYGQSSERKSFESDVLWKKNRGFMKEYPVILSTTHSLRKCAPDHYLFDYVLVDEASQVDLVTGCLAMSSARKAGIVGDVQQLPNVVPTELQEKTKKVFHSYALNQAYDYAQHSLLSSLLSLFDNLPSTLLKEHYRCHPQIIGFCNQKFYRNQLIIMTDNQSEKPLAHYKTKEGNHARGMKNQRQVEVIYDEAIPQQVEEGRTVGIIAPYRDQVNQLRQNTTQDIEIDTVHKYQGREKDYIILSTVSNHVKANDFVDSPNLINVAVSRAVEKLIVVTEHDSEQWKGTNIGDLVRYIKYNEFDVIESTIYSVFDLLYSDYSKKLLKTLSKTKRVSQYKSENVMNTVIEDVLNNDLFRGLDVVLHQPLRMLLKDTSKLTEEELTYAMRSGTHTDFLIYSKIDKMPVLVIEVDGPSHENDPEQIERDRKKDSILKKYNIPILRLKTTGSREAEVLSEKLEELI